MHFLPALLLFATAGQEPPTLTIPRIPAEVARPRIDGVLAEDFWAHCAEIDTLVQTEPVAGAQPSEATEILLGYDDANLYVGLRCFDRDPGGIRATQMARDANLDPDDRVELLFDSFHDKRNGFWFQIGAAGSKGDALISGNGSEFNKQWDTIWHGAAEVTQEGWFAEISIPFASINFDPQKGTWGFNVRRFIRRRTEEVRWANAEPRLRFFAAANAGTLEGLGGMRQGLGLDVIPFGVGSYRSDDTRTDSVQGDAGLDLFYRISPATKLSLSFNTDFAETEVDTRRVNLTRFPLFFPEKRKFFLEDSGAFAFGPGGHNGGRDVLPFFSRRIGLDEDGGEVPLLANAKLTTTNDSYRLGLLDSQTDSTGTLPSRNLFVGRFSKNIFDRSNVGVIFTHGDPTGSQSDYTVGADLNLSTAEFLGDRNLRFNAYAVKAEDSDTSGKDLAYYAGVSYPNDEIELSASYMTIEENFQPALGFAPRTGIHKYEAEVEYQPRMHNSIRQLQFEVSPSLTTNTSGRTESADLSAIPFGLTWESGEEFRTWVSPQRENLDEAFEISDGVVIPLGTHDFVRYGMSFETSNKRPVSADLEFGTGTFYDGHRNDYELELDWRANRYAIFGAEYRLNDVSLAGGDFDVNIVRAKADLHFSPRASWSNFVQWDDVSDDLGLNSRLRFIFQPGSDLFVVLNQGWNTYGDRFAPVSTDLRFKVSYTLRF